MTIIHVWMAQYNVVQGCHLPRKNKFLIFPGFFTNRKPIFPDHHMQDESSGGKATKRS